MDGNTPDVWTVLRHALVEAETASDGLFLSIEFAVTRQLKRVKLNAKVIGTTGRWMLS